MGLDDWLVQVSWLGKLVSVIWCVKLDFFSLECNGVSSVEFEMGLCVWVILGSLYVDAQGYVPALLENLCGMSCSGTYWLFSIHSEGLPERFTELHEEEEWEEGDRDKQVVQKGDSRGERQIYAVLCSLSVLHSPEHPQRFTELD